MYVDGCFAYIISEGFDDAVEERVINEEYKIWKKNTLRVSLCIDKYHFLDLYGLCNMKKQSNQLL
jgi:hypothetical protein